MVFYPRYGLILSNNPRNWIAIPSSPYGRRKILQINSSEWWTVLIHTSDKSLSHSLSLSLLKINHLKFWETFWLSFITRKSPNFFYSFWRPKAAFFPNEAFKIRSLWNAQYLSNPKIPPCNLPHWFCTERNHYIPHTNFCHVDYGKVQIFWEGLKNLEKYPDFFEKLGNICGLLIIRTWILLWVAKF